MDQGPLAAQIVEAFGMLSGQLQVAARYVLDHPRDVALLSMREQARKAGVQPATMTRFAKHLGLDGYDQVRDVYAEAVRGGSIGFTNKAGEANHKHKGDKSLAADMVRSLAQQLALLGEPDFLDSIVNAAEVLSKARKIYCMSLRSMHPVAWHFQYIMSLIGDSSILLDGLGNTGMDAFSRATRDDILLAATVSPYTRATVEAAELAASRDIRIVAITDSVVSPLAQLAQEVILVPTDSPGFFHAMSPAFFAAEILAALVASRSRDKALDALRKLDEHLADMKTHMQPHGDKPTR